MKIKMNTKEMEATIKKLETELDCARGWIEFIDQQRIDESEYNTKEWETRKKSDKVLRCRRCGSNPFK